MEEAHKYQAYLVCKTINEGHVRYQFIAYFLLVQNVKKVIATRMMTEAQLQRLVKSLNIPAHSCHADDMDAAITSAGLQLPRETRCKKKRTSLTLNKSSTSAKNSQGTQKSLPPPQLAKPLAKKPKLDTENLSHNDTAQNFSAMVSGNYVYEYII